MTVFDDLLEKAVTVGAISIKQLAAMEGVRDMSIPYTENEIQKVLAKLRTFRTYDPATDSIGTDDTVNSGLALGIGNSDEQNRAYASYFDRNHGGRCNLTDYERLMRSLHTVALQAVWYADMCDLNKDGAISRSEFEQIYELMSIQWPAIAGKSYEDFAEEADTNRDGIVQISEMQAWIEKKAAEGKR